MKKLLATVVLLATMNVNANPVEALNESLDLDQGIVNYDNYTILMSKKYKYEGETCRDYVITDRVNNSFNPIQGSACRIADREWLFME